MQGKVTSVVYNNKSVIFIFNKNVNGHNINGKIKLRKTEINEKNINKYITLSTKSMIGERQQIAVLCKNRKQNTMINYKRH